MMLILSFNLCLLSKYGSLGLVCNLFNLIVLYPTIGKFTALLTSRHESSKIDGETEKS